MRKMVQYSESVRDHGKLDHPYFSDITVDSLSASSYRNEYDMRIASVCKRAILKKVKTNKNKFFVLYKATASIPARLEYYDSESQWHKQKKPRRTIYLKTCFNISEFSDSRNKYGLTLYTKDDSFQIGFDCEQERDMWLADMSFLTRSGAADYSHGVDGYHQWKVNVSTRNMNCIMCGRYSLLLQGQLAVLVKESPLTSTALHFPPESVICSSHSNTFFIMEVNEQAPTGPGEIWMELEDELIADHVHRVFSNSVLVGGGDGFRPVSKSFSHKKKQSPYLRMRCGSDAKFRCQDKQGKAKPVASRNAESAPFSQYMQQRERTGSIESCSTSTSQSAEDSDGCSKHGTCGSRSVTPDQRKSAAVTYKRGDDDSNQNSLHMSSHYQYHAQRGNSYIWLESTNQNISGYLDMTCGKTSPRIGSQRKPEPVISYLVDEDDNAQRLGVNSHVLRSRSPVYQQQQGRYEYVEMCPRATTLSGMDKKSTSAPHLPPAMLSQQQPDCRDSALTCVDIENGSHRPRGSTWSQSVRPATDLHPNSSHGSRRPSNSIPPKITFSDYIDMACGKASPYIDMTSSQRKTLLAADGKENFVPHCKSHRSNPTFSEPFPELSASSEDEVSLHSMEESISLHSAAGGSIDSVSMSSQSSSYASSAHNSLYTDLEPTSINSKCRKAHVTPKATSYICEDASLDSRCYVSDYTEMAAVRK